jgi:hypothetical protein
MVLQATTAHASEPARDAFRQDLSAFFVTAPRGRPKPSGSHTLRRSRIAPGALGTGLRHDLESTPDPAQCVAECIDRNMFATGKHVAQHVSDKPVASQNSRRV